MSHQFTKSLSIFETTKWQWELCHFTCQIGSFQCYVVGGMVWYKHQLTNLLAGLLSSLCLHIMSMVFVPEIFSGRHAKNAPILPFLIFHENHGVFDTNIKQRNYSLLHKFIVYFLKLHWWLTKQFYSPNQWISNATYVCGRQFAINMSWLTCPLEEV